MLGKIIVGDDDEAGVEMVDPNKVRTGTGSDGCGKLGAVVIQCGLTTRWHDVTMLWD